MSNGCGGTWSGSASCTFVYGSTPLGVFGVGTIGVHVWITDGVGNVLLACGGSGLGSNCKLNGGLNPEQEPLTCHVVSEGSAGIYGCTSS